jgi:hypothetical protein
MTASRTRIPLALALALQTGALVFVAAWAATAGAKTSHAGWPQINGRHVRHGADQSTPIHGLRHKHNELLGGHGDDTITAGDVGDVIWGDYKPSGQPATQNDVLTGGPGKDFIYASHGRNTIVSNGGADQIHAHFGHGSITCTTTQPLVFLSHRSKKLYKLHGCPRITFRLGG